MATDISITIDQNALGLVWDRRLGKPIGTAFVFIKPTWAVTAKHVVLDNGVHRTDLEVRLATGMTSARVLFAHPEVDLAVLQLDKVFCPRPLYPAHQSLTGSGGLISAGYTPSLKAQNEAPSILVNHVPNFTPEPRERSKFVEETIRFQADFSVPGNSGGPVFGAGGGVVGVIVENQSDGDRLIARATSITPLLDQLEFKKNG